MFQLRASLAGVNLTESEVEELTNKGVGTITKVKYKTSSPKEALKCISHPWEIMTDRRIDQSTDQQTNMSPRGFIGKINFINFSCELLQKVFGFKKKVLRDRVFASLT